MHKITIDIENDSDFELIKGLAQRLGLPISEHHVVATAKQKVIFENLFGSWKSEESGDELAAMIRNDRQEVHL